MNRRKANTLTREDTGEEGTYLRTYKAQQSGPGQRNEIEKTRAAMLSKATGKPGPILDVLAHVSARGC